MVSVGIVVVGVVGVIVVVGFIFVFVVVIVADDFTDLRGALSPPLPTFLIKSGSAKSFNCKKIIRLSKEAEIFNSDPSNLTK